MSEVSKIYGQFAESLRDAHEQHHENLRQHSQRIHEMYSSVFEPHLVFFKSEFEDQVRRLELRNLAETFLGTAEIPFVAIDGSCARDIHSGYYAFFGGAYGSRGTVSLTGSGGSLVYRRWEFNRDVSMVAFIPIPPEGGGAIIDQPEGADFPHAATDDEVAQISSLHTKIMQLAEVFLAYSLVGASTVDAPRVMLLDGSLSGLLGNTSFSPDRLRLYHGEFDGLRLTRTDAYVALAHPLSRDLGVPSWKRFQPQNRLIAEATWNETSRLDLDAYSKGRQRLLTSGGNFLQRKGVGNLVGDHFEFSEDPRGAWRRCTEIAEGICNDLFREKQSEGMTFALREAPDRREYLTVRDVQFLTGVILRGLIERCWSRGVLLVGVAKDSNSRYYSRNYLGTLKTLQEGAPGPVQGIHLTDRTVLELLPNVVEGIEAPWGTVEFDSAFMTLRPRSQNDQPWSIHGTPNPRLGETTRPERLFLRSIIQFFLRPEKGLASHAVFIDRLAYPGWDDVDSKEQVVPTEFFGHIRPLQFEGEASRLQRLTTYLLTVLVRNHFPEAIGYPDPLHKADWGAKSMRRRVQALLESSSWVERSDPRGRTFRQIREQFRR